jgi:hypothetical protein
MANEQYKTVDKFDRALGSLAGLPDVTKTPPSTVTAFTPLIGAAQTFIIQTFRQTERDTLPNGDTVSRSRDTLFLQYVDDTGAVRMVIPHGAIDAIIRQRDSLTTRVRKRVGKESAAARKARGELPGFMKSKKK